MDEKGANTFPFHNLPPEPKIFSKKVFPVLLYLSLILDKIKVGGDSCLPQHCFAKSKLKSSQFLHRGYRTGDSAGDFKINFLNKRGVTLEFRSLLITLLV